MTRAVFKTRAPQELRVMTAASQWADIER